MRKKLIIAGGSGMIGHLLAQHFVAQHYDVVVLSRSQSKERNGVRFVQWDGVQLGEWVQELENSEGVINLTGKTVNSRPTKANKEEIITSRVLSTKLVGHAINQCNIPPKVWINAGGAGVFSGIDHLPKDEQSPLGNEFAADVARAWENAFDSIATPATRKVYMRIGLVLKAHEGLLEPLEKLVKLGLGGAAGSGKQYYPWIHYQDLLQIVEYLLTNPNASGIYHAVGPDPVTNATFMQSLRQIHGISFGLPAPDFAVIVGAYIIGTNGALALSDNYVFPKRLLSEGYKFLFSDIRTALEDLYTS
jgi:hypothetical protein